MFFSVSLYIALALFLLGLFYRISSWFRYSLVEEDSGFSSLERFSSTLRSILGVVFSGKIVALLKAILFDVILQVRTLKESPSRWLMHILIYYGFMLLLLMHALEDLISVPIFADYQSTLNPYAFLRDLFGFMMIAGILIALYRRVFMKLPRLKTNAMDRYAIFILAVIILSGIFLEGLKITSYTAFREMEEEYAGLDEQEELKALESFWIQNFGVVSPHMAGPFDATMLSRGKEIHEMNCAGCHSSPKWAFTGFSVAKMIGPIATQLDGLGASTFLWTIHFLACFIGLAYLPFSKMFHIVASPVSLLTNAVIGEGEPRPAIVATKQIMELDACTHCGACSLRCAAGMAFEVFPNVNILPSEKIATLRKMVKGKDFNEKEQRELLEGLTICTNCHRCTDVCPVGINLQEIWSRVREDLLQKGHPEISLLSPLSLYRGLKCEDWEQALYQNPIHRAKESLETAFRVEIQENTLDASFRENTLKDRLRISAQSSTFSHCYNCKTCTNACPLIYYFDSPQKVLGLLPHQIMQATALGLEKLILGSTMLWACLGCYRCQEQCPQGVRITDVFYELKNLAVDKIKERPLESSLGNA